MKFRFPGLKILDRYIIRKFLGTWVFAIAMFVVILVVFDYAEKVDDFITNKAPLQAIWVQYYLNFIPSFINQFSGLLTFIAVVFFTSKMAYNTEIVAMLSSGESFRRLMWPYFLSATAIMVLALTLNLWVIPRANDRIVAFEQTYITRVRNASRLFDADIYRQVGPGTFVYLRNFDGETNRAGFFAIEKYEGGRLVETLEAADAAYNEETGRWNAALHIRRRLTAPGGPDYSGVPESAGAAAADSLPEADSLATTDSLRNADPPRPAASEAFTRYLGLDTLINLNTTELGNVDRLIKTMSIGELNRFMGEQREKGSDMMEVFEVERQSRFSYPAAIFILTLIGVSLSSRKVRGGTGLHMGLGISLCFAYILFSRFAEEFAKGGILPAGLSVWIPNILFAAIALWLYVKAPK